ncbi:hypothetical protein ACFQYP_16335 [Nonomuraea antimicrobica]
MPLKIVFVLLVVYAVTAAPLFLPGELRVVVQPGTDDAAEVYYEAVSPVMLRSYEGTEPFNRAQLLAEQRAEAYPEDLAPPYIAHGATYRLVAPYVTARGARWPLRCSRGRTGPRGNRSGTTSCRRYGGRVAVQWDPFARVIVLQ